MLIAYTEGEQSEMIPFQQKENHKAKASQTTKWAKKSFFKG